MAEMKMAGAPDIPSHIVLATDFTARCDRAQDRAVQLALHWNASLTAVHALSDMVLTDDPSIRDSYRSAALRSAASLREELACIDGLRSSVTVQEGAVDAVVLELAARQRAGLIVTGIARSGPFARVLVGSNVTALARTSPVPVLVVKKRPLDTRERTIVATDLSESSRSALIVAMQWFPPRRLVLFHGFEPPYRGLVDDKPDYDRRFEVAAIEQCRAFLGDAAGEDAVSGFDIVARRGDPVTGLQVLANEADTDLVIAGTHGRTGLLHAFVGSVASQILEAVPCDVLVVPGRGSGAAPDGLPGSPEEPA